MLLHWALSPRGQQGVASGPAPTLPARLFLSGRRRETGNELQKLGLSLIHQVPKLVLFHAHQHTNFTLTSRLLTDLLPQTFTVES